MRLIVIFLVLYTLLPVSVFSQYTFERIINTPEIAVGASVIQCDDGGFAIVGTMLNPTSENILIRTNAKGEVLWSYEYSIQGVEHAMNVHQSDDKGFFISGWTTVGNGMSLIKVDSIGGYQWSFTYGKDGTKGRYGDAIVEVDNGYIMLGTFNDNDGEKTFAVRVDLNGSVKWSRVIYSSSEYETTAAILTSDSNVVGVGEAFHDSSGVDMMIWKIDVKGNVQWVYNYDMGQDELGASLVEKTNGDYHILGTYHSTGAIEKYLYLIVDKDGVIQDIHGLMDGSSSGAARILGDDPNESIILGESYLDKGLLYKVDAKGNPIWSRQFAHGALVGWGPASSTATSLCADGGLIITGWSKLGTQAASISLIKTDLNGETLCSDTGLVMTPWNVSMDRIAYAYTDSDQITQAGYPLSVDPVVTSDTILCFEEPILTAEFEVLNVCEGDSVHFTNTSTGSIIPDMKWSFGDGAVSSEVDPVHFYTQPGTYDVELIAYHVLVSDTIVKQVTVHPKPNILLEYDTNLICQNKDALISYTASGGGAYQWYEMPERHLIDIDAFTVLPAINKDYLLRVISNEGCIKDSLFSVDVLDAPEVPFEISYLRDDCYPTQITLDRNESNSEAIDSMLFYRGDNSKIKDPDLPHHYTYDHHPDSTYPANYRVLIDVYYSNGCRNQLVEHVIVCEDVYIPNVFTPNKDGQNDFFELKGLDESNCELSVFDRFGIKVFESLNYQNDWDGRDRNGRQLKPDVYFYIIKCAGSTHTSWVKILP